MSDTNEAASGDDEKDYDSDDAILSRARREYRMCQDAEGTNRQDALDDLQFLLGGENQWDPRAVAARKADGRPIITVNDLPTFLHQVTNDQRQNTPSIKVHPVGNGADVETAKIRQGAIRHIEYDSNADVAYDRAVNSAAAIGFGYWYLDTEWAGDTKWTQKIVFRSVRNHLAVHIDPLSIEADGSDMRFGFIETLMGRKDFEKEHPKAKANDVSLFNGTSDYSGWLSDTAVLVCRYYCIKTTEAEVVLLSNGESGFKDDLIEMPDGVAIVKTRAGERKQVMLYKITGVDVLEKTEIKCKWIPIFPVYGDEVDIEGKVNRAGLIRNAKGPYQAYNVMMSGATEEVALRTKAPYIGAEGFMEGHEDEWAQANNRSFPALEYKLTSIDGKIAPAPARQPMADIPAGMLAMAMHAQDNKKKTMGLFDASIGARGTATSGKQEIAQQREGDMANFHYSDGLLRTVRHCGRCLNCMFPNYYDTQQILTIMREDGTQDYVEINKPLDQPERDEKTGAIRTLMNDMTCGEFSVTVSAGPSYSTMRQENQEFFTNAMQAAKDPATASVVTYLAMSNSDSPDSELATKMLKVLLPPPVQSVLDEDKGQSGGGKEAPQVIQTPKGPLPVAQVPQVLAQLEQQLQAAGEAVEKSQADKNAAEVMRQQNEQQKNQLDAERVRTEQFQAETERMKAGQDAEADKLKAIADAKKYENEQLNAQADLIRAAAENIRAQMEADAPKETNGEQPAPPVPTLEDIAQLIIASRQPINGMTITAPSGQNYRVKMM